MLKAFWAEGKEYPEEGGCIVIARDESDALPHGLKALNVSPDEINLYSAETAKGELHERLCEIDEAMQKASDETRIKERSACADVIAEAIAKCNDSIAHFERQQNDAYEHHDAALLQQSCERLVVLREYHDKLSKLETAIRARNGGAK